jgi:hypothetical protein
LDQCCLFWEMFCSLDDTPRLLCSAWMLGIIKLKVVIKGGTADFAFGPISSWVSPFLFNAMAQDSWTCFLSPARFNIGEEISTKNWDTIFFFFTMAYLFIGKYLFHEKWI